MTTATTLTPPAAAATADTQIAVSAHRLAKRYPGDVGVLGIDLTIRRNEVFGLVGPNGAGKTTLLSLLCGLTAPDDGRIEINGRLALCPDTPEFEPWLTGVEVLRQSFALARPGRPLDDAAVRAIMVDTGIDTYADRRCGGFSRGMTQRLGIAAALVVDPDVLVLDEPTSALDTAGRADVLALIRKLGTQRTVVLSSHALADVQRTATDIAVMDSGTVLFAGTPQTLINEHLRPAWRVVLAEDATTVAQALHRVDWVRSVRPHGSDSFDVETQTLALGEERLVPALATLRARVLSLAPVDADLESAFLALTGRAPREDPR